MAQWLRGSNRAANVVFLGGAPRAGTTVAHALLCSAAGASRFHPEIAFFRGVALAYRSGLEVWDEQTSAFFTDQAEVRVMIRDTAQTWLDQIWAANDKPEILCVKDPYLTPFFPNLRDLLPDAKFVTVCRNPMDVVRSRQDVAEKMEAPFGKEQAIAVAQQYLQFYTRVLGNNFAGRHFIFRYEDLEVQPMRDALARFLGAEGFDPDRMWQGGQPAQRAAAGKESAWMSSPKSHRPVDLTPRHDPLPDDWQDAVKSVCAPIMQVMGYC